MKKQKSRRLVGGKYSIKDLKEKSLRLKKEIAERKKIEEALVRRDYQLEILSRTNIHINVILEIPVILRTLIEAAMELVRAKAGMAGLLKNGKIVFKEYASNGKMHPVNYAFERGQGPAGITWSTKRPYISHEAKKDSNISKRLRKTLKLHNLVNIPIINSKGIYLGCFEVHNREDMMPFDSQDVFMLQGLAASAAVALENALMLAERKRSEKQCTVMHNEIVKSNKKLRRLALIDSQTGLYNHRYLAEFIETELNRTKRFNAHISLTLLDIDYFQSINDLYGHQFGDMVLKQFAHCLRKIVRRYDILVRYGGEEFIIISPGIEKTRAMKQAQRIMEYISSYSFGDKTYSIKLKLSMAVASYPEDNIAKGIDLVNIADKILHKVKDEGGNKLYSAEDMLVKKNNKKNSHMNVSALENRIEKLTKSGKQSLMQSIFAFAKAIELRDHYTGEHVENTVYYATEIAKRLNLSGEDISNIRQASMLHDLGKIGISDNILHKKSMLTKHEYEEIKKHPQIGADIIRPMKFMHDIVPLVLYHHERWDGNGYPSKLKGEEIPLGARIIAVADVYQALTSDRPYRKAFSKEKAIEIIKKSAGEQFDPKIIKIFLEILKNCPD